MLAQFSGRLGEERSQGVEVELIGDVTDRLSVRCNYAYADTEPTDEVNPDVFFGQRQRNVSYNTASMWGRYDLIDDCCHTLGVGTGLLWVDDRTADLAATLLLPSYTRWDAGVFYERAVGMRRSTWKISATSNTPRDRKTRCGFSPEGRLTSAA